MTKTPPVLPETPHATSDLLSDVLGAMRLRGMVLFRGEFREPWSVLAADCRQMVRMLPFRTEHAVPFHVIAKGGCWLEMPDGQTAWLGEGDAVLLPYGEGHRMGGREPAGTVHVGSLLPAPPWTGIPVVTHGGPGPETRILCGFVQCDELLFHPFLRYLPPLVHARRDDTGRDDWLSSTIRRTAEEASRPMPGSRSMLRLLTEVMFVEILRRHMQNLTGEDIGWFAAMNDPIAGEALNLMHAEPRRGWSVEELARAAGTSKTVLGTRFHHYLEQPPMQYLASWRMQLAAQMIRSEDVLVKTVADRSGYASEAAFSRAFKRRFGAAPAIWRQQQVQH
jgi:AraC-like DNA-binding protein